MGKLSITLKEAIVKAELYPLATASSSGLPNVIPIKLVFIENDNELWLIDNFMTKTLQNLQPNPTQRGLMPGLTFSNELISRDEG